MAELQQLTDEMKAAIGQSAPAVRCEVTSQGIRMFARAVGYRDNVFFDEEEARARGHHAVPAPPGFLGTVADEPTLERLELRPSKLGQMRVVRWDVSYRSVDSAQYGLHVWARVRRKYRLDGEGRVELDVGVRGAGRREGTPGHATVALPLRST